MDNETTNKSEVNMFKRNAEWQAVTIGDRLFDEARNIALKSDMQVLDGYTGWMAWVGYSDSSEIYEHDYCTPWFYSF